MLQPCRLSSCSRICGLEKSLAKNAAVSAAHKGLGITWREYRTIFGTSGRVAEGVVQRLAAGVPAAVILAAAREAA